MAKRIFAFLSILLFINIVIIGIFSWNSNQEKTVANAIQSLENQTSNEDPRENENENQNESKDPDQKLNRVQLGYVVQDFPEAVINRFSEAFDGGEPVKFVLAGSESLGYDDGGWSTIVEQELENLYGENLLDVIVYEFNGTTTQFLESGAADEVARMNADMLLFETLTLEDNSGLVMLDQTLANLKEIVDIFMEQNPDLYLVLQPPQPIFTTVYYPDQVRSVKQFANENSIPFLDHWTEWPDYATEEILDYLTDESAPNEKGHEVWAKAVIDFFDGNPLE